MHELFNALSNETFRAGIFVGCVGPAILILAGIGLKMLVSGGGE